ncbi:MAG: hypothetical protein JWR26_48 [Pedosphaera sp.]|nr:hypothetical protein [Pedosphaera sp.]
MICEKSGRFRKIPINIGRNGVFFQKGGFQKNDVKSTIDYNLATTVWDTRCMNIKNSSWRVRRETRPLTARRRSRRAMAWRFAEGKEFQQSGGAGARPPSRGGALWVLACSGAVDTVDARDQKDRRDARLRLDHGQRLPGGAAIIGAFKGRMTIGCELPAGLGMTRLNTLDYAWSGLLTLKSWMFFCVLADGHQGACASTPGDGQWSGGRKRPSHAFAPLGNGLERLRTAWIGFFGAYMFFPGVCTRPPRCLRTATMGREWTNIDGMDAHGLTGTGKMPRGSPSRARIWARQTGFPSLASQSPTQDVRFAKSNLSLPIVGWLARVLWHGFCAMWARLGFEIRSFNGHSHGRVALVETK